MGTRSHPTPARRSRVRASSGNKLHDSSVSARKRSCECAQAAGLCTISRVAYHLCPMARRPNPNSRTVRLKPSNPFDLIRLLARSQSDPRKAVCELVQNSLDAQARRIEITWKNEHGLRTLRIWD